MLTRRQEQMLALLMQGRTNKEIAAELGIGEPTLKICLTQVFAKIGARNRTEAALWGVRRVHSEELELLRWKLERLTRMYARLRFRLLG